MESRKISPEGLRDLLDAHRDWVCSDGKTGRRADLSDVDLAWAELASVLLTKADLSGADLFHADLARACLRDASLRGAKLCAASLPGADLEGADLVGADLFMADAAKANLERANLEGANLLGADFEGANFHGARVRGACLQGANLTGATLEGADLAEADIAGVTPSHLQAALGEKTNGTPLRHLAAPTETEGKARRAQRRHRKLPPDRRRLEVAALLHSGRKTREIAAQLRVSPSTIRRDKRALCEETERFGVCPVCHQTLPIPAL